MTDIPIAQSNATAVLPSYLYAEYSDDEDLQAFINAYNDLAQGYVDWFNQNPFALYTAPAISGLLLDWIGNGLYGITRPTIGNASTFNIGAVNTWGVNTLAVNQDQGFGSGAAFPASDDIYKRVLTWWFYRGDGRIPSIDWILRRITRFLNGVNGSDIIYPPVDPTIAIPKLAVSSSAFTITVPTTTISQALQSLIRQNLLALPFENTFTVVLT